MRPTFPNDQYTFTKVIAVFWNMYSMYYVIYMRSHWLEYLSLFDIKIVLTYSNGCAEISDKIV